MIARRTGPPGSAHDLAEERSMGLNFDLTEEETQIRDTIRGFCEDELRPIVQELDDSARFPVAIFKKLADLGFLGLPYPEKYGGIGASTLAYITVVEEIARVCASTALGYAAHVSLGINPIYAFGSDAQREKYMPTLCAGVENGKLALGCFGLTEPGAGSDSGGTTTTATPKSGGGWVVNGRKAWITNASHAKTCVITAKTDTAAPRGKGISAFLIECASPGFAVEREEDKLGMRSSNTCQLAFTDMAIAPDAELGGEGGKGDGFKAFMKTLDGGRISIGALGLGIAQGAFERATAYVKERRQFGKPIGTFQGVAFKIADMSMEIAAARHLVYHAARLRDAGRPFGLEASHAKLYSSEVAMRASHQAIQCLGGVGYCREYDVERMFRDAKLCEIGEGTSEIQRMKIAREVLGRLE
jgi:alkylation response protein AidB-like acyl-CoA dehydrogenase